MNENNNSNPGRIFILSSGFVFAPSREELAEELEAMKEQA